MLLALMLALEVLLSVPPLSQAQGTLTGYTTAVPCDGYLFVGRKKVRGLSMDAHIGMPGALSIPTRQDTRAWNKYPEGEKSTAGDRRGLHSFEEGLGQPPGKCLDKEAERGAASITFQAIQRHQSAKA